MTDPTRAALAAALVAALDLTAPQAQQLAHDLGWVLPHWRVLAGWDPTQPGGWGDLRVVFVAGKVSQVVPAPVVKPPLDSEQ